MATELEKLVVRIEADLAGFRSGLKQAERETRRSSRTMATALDNANRASGRLTRGIFNLRNAILVGLGTAALRKTITSFADFESGMARIGKTTGIVGPELTKLGVGLQKLARLPETGQTITQLQQIAEAAGQLGVSGEKDIIKFTEVMAQMAGASDVAGDAGARLIARFLGLSGLPISAADNMTSAVVALGQSAKATESEILAVALEVAKAGTIFNLAGPDALGIATAFVEMGVEAAVAGTTVSKVLLSIQERVTTGKDGIDALTKALGKTREEILDLLQTDSGQLFEDFVSAGAELEGGALISFLEELDLNDIRIVKSLGAVIKQVDNLTSKIDQSSDEWEKNTARVNEALAQAKTFTSQMRTVANVVDEAAVEIGRELAPVVLELATSLREFIAEAKDSGELKEFAEDAGKALKFLAENVDLLAAALAGLLGLNIAAKLALLFANLSPIARVATLAAAGIGLLATQSETAAAGVGLLAQKLHDLATAPSRAQSALLALNEDINTVRASLNEFLNENISSALGISPETLRGMINPVDVFIERLKALEEQYRRIRIEAAFGGPPSILRGPGGGGAQIGPDRQTRDLGGLAGRIDEARRSAGSTGAEGESGGVASLSDAQETALKTIEQMVEALEQEALVAGTAASKREELTAILALENAARAGGVAVSAEQLERAKASIAITQQQIKEEEMLASIRETETGLADENELLARRLELFGQSEIIIERELALLKDRQDLGALGAEQVRDERVERAALLTQIERQTDAEALLQEIKDSQITTNAELATSTLNLQGAATAFAGSVSSAFEDAIIAGKDLSSVIDGLEEDMIRLLARLLITEPLEKGLRTGLAAFETPGAEGPGGIEGLVGGGLTGVANLFPSAAPGVGLGDFNKIAEQGPLGGDALEQFGGFLSKDLGPASRGSEGAEELENIFGELAGASEELASTLTETGAEAGVAAIGLSATEVAAEASSGVLGGGLVESGLELIATKGIENVSSTTLTASLQAFNIACIEATACLKILTLACQAAAASGGGGGGEGGSLVPGPFSSDLFGVPFLGEAANAGALYYSGGASASFNSNIGGSSSGSVNDSSQGQGTSNFDLSNQGSFHKGGIVGRAGVPSPGLPASTWRGAPRLHAGGIPGLRPDEVPAILQRGEEVIPRGGGGRGDIHLHGVRDFQTFKQNMPQFRGQLAELQDRGQRKDA